MCWSASDLHTFLDRNPELAPGQFEAFAALRTRVFVVTTDEALGVTVSDQENRFDVKVQQVAIFWCQNKIRSSKRKTLMIDFLLSLPTWPGSLVAMGFTAVTGFVVYLVSYRLISKYKREDMKEPTNNLFRVVGTLVSLMLALAFSEVSVDFRTIRNAVQSETVAISDMFEGLKLFDSERTREQRTILIDYAQAVIDDDWPSLANDRLSQRVSDLRRQLAKGVMRLKPANPTQETMLSQIMADMDVLSDYRIVRLDSALAKPSIYVYVVIFGFLVTMACFGDYQPQPPLVVLAFLYTIFVGLVLYLVLAMSDPFQGNFGVGPVPFEHLVETLQSEIR